jgi:hypothetical protein
MHCLRSSCFVLLYGQKRGTRRTIGYAIIAPFRRSVRMDSADDRIHFSEL